MIEWYSYHVSIREGNGVHDAWEGERAVELRGRGVHSVEVVPGKHTKWVRLALLIRRFKTFFHTVPLYNTKTHIKIKPTILKERGGGRCYTACGMAYLPHIIK